MAWLAGWKEISAHLGCCNDTAKKHVKKHKLPVYRDPGGRPVAFPEELNEWMERFEKKRGRKRRGENEP